MEPDQGVVTYAYIGAFILMSAGALLTLAIQQFIGYKDGTRRIGLGAGLVIVALLLLWVAWWIGAFPT